MRHSAFALAALMLLAGCNSKPKPAANSLDAMDEQLVNGAVVAETPANKALAADIKVDPARAGKHHRAPDAPLGSDEGGPTGGGEALADNGTGGATQGGCLGGLDYSNGWAAKLPADLPMHPSAKLQEAAGHDGGCEARIVSFAVPGDRGQVLGWYVAKAKAAGYSAGRADKGGDWILMGDKGDSAYAIIVGPAAGGETPVDYVWTRGG